MVVEDVVVMGVAVVTSVGGVLGVVLVYLYLNIGGVCVVGLVLVGV